MTRLLVSVRSCQEARGALRGGCQLIDVKEPRRGALGAADSLTWKRIRAVVPQRVPMSVALGELRQPHLLELARVALGDLAKIGLAHCAGWPPWKSRWREAVQRLPGGIAPVAVVYADWRMASAPPPEDVLETAQSLGCAAMLLDTYDKSAGDLFHVMPPEELWGCIKSARAAGMAVVLGGSLSLDSLPRALQLAPDYIAVRGAVCAPSRTGKLRIQLVRQLADSLRHAARR